MILQPDSYSQWMFNITELPWDFKIFIIKVSLVNYTFAVVFEEVVIPYIFD